MGKCAICGDIGTLSGWKPSAYDGKTKACEKCRYAESMMRVSDPCVRIEGKTPEECGISECLWTQKVLETRKNTDKYLMGRLV